MSAEGDGFVDTHVHFWDHSIDGLRWPWLEAGFKHPRGKQTPRLDAPRYAVDEFKEETRGSGVSKVVHVEATAWSSAPERETAWLQGLGDERGSPHGIIGGCRLADANAADVVRAHRRYSRFRGVRNLSPAPASFIEEPVRAHYAGAAALAGTVELTTRQEAFAFLADMAELAPGVTMILGHAGLPIERTEVTRTEWSSGLKRLARKPNIVCKIIDMPSGFGPGWTIEAIRPWVMGCIEAFGADRCMLATNWPVDRLYTSYSRLVDAYREIIAVLGDTDRSAVLRGTAERVYRI